MINYHYLSEPTLMSLFRCIILCSERLQCKTVFPLVWRDSVFGMYLCSPGIVTTHTHLLMIDV